MSTFLKISTPILLVILLSSCKSWDFHTFPITHIKNYPKNTPFVYKTNINLPGNLSKKEKDNLESGLKAQLEDSVNPKANQKIFWQVIKKPPVFDTTYVQSSRRFMLAMLHSSGYFRAAVSYDTSIKRHGESNKLTLNFNVTPGPLWHFDSVWYSIQQPEMQHIIDSTLRTDSTKRRRVDTTTLPGLQQPFQHIADSTTSESFLRKGSSFSQDTIGMELDRLTELYRNNGYMRFTRNELVAVWDTLDALFLKPTVNELEEFELIDKLANEKQNPTATLEIKLRAGYDSARLTRFFIGKVYVFPDFGTDSTLKRDTVVLDPSYSVIYNQYLFKPKILPQNIFLRHGQVYNQNRYLRTIDRFNSNVAWRFVTMDQRIRPGTDTVDFYLKLVPSLKYLFSANLEGSRNDNTSPLIVGNLLGLGVNVSLQNRNFAKVGAQTNINVRYGTELSISKTDNFVSSREASIGYNIIFPKIIPHFNFLPEQFRDARTILAFNLSNTQRLVLYNLTSYNTSWGYELQRRNKIWGFKIPNIEYSLLDARDTLKQIIANNPGLKNLFNDGLVVSVIGSLTVNWGTKKNLNTVKANIEESGLLTRLIPSDFIKKNLYRFIKPNAEYIRIMKVGKNDFVTRVFAGVGIPLRIDTGSGFRSEYLPFFKAYSAGGPNSMRGWGLRRLGPGHSLNYVKDFPDRFGDMQFETNLEYRFYLFKLFGFKFNSAFFTDIGNVWFLHKSPDFPGGEFTFTHFLKDLGIDVGTGVRIDLGFFLIRLDYALKVHNPSPEPVNAEAQDHYFYKWNWKYLLGGVLQFGVTYPFL
ncbi:MAG: BamA/TamA family outer membrane protein [Chitinophagales bacterium]